MKPLLSRIAQYGMVPAFLALLIIFSFITSRMIPVWHDPETLWTYAIKQRPSEAGIAYFNRGYFYKETGRYEEALKDMQKSLEILQRYHSIRTYRAYAGIGDVYMKMHRYADAVEEYSKAIELARVKPEREYFIQRGTAYQALGRKDEAERDFAIANAPGHG